VIVAARWLVAIVAVAGVLLDAVVLTGVTRSAIIGVAGAGITPLARATSPFAPE